mgnify:CR=1 FL=1
MNVEEVESAVVTAMAKTIQVAADAEETALGRVAATNAATMPACWPRARLTRIMKGL